MPQVSISPISDSMFLSNLGKPLSGGKLYSYAAGSFSTLQTTYSDADGTIANANPIVLNSSGRLPVQVFLESGLVYNIVLQDASGNILQNWDDIEGSVNASYVAAEIAALSGDYLPVTGGTITGSLTVSGTTTLGTTATGAISASGTITTSSSISAVGVSAGGAKVTSVGTPTVSTDAATKAYVDSAAGSVAAPPIGSMLMWPASTSAGASWLTCDGTAVSRTTYASLFALIGTTYGAGNGTTTFNLPDMRGVFPRGLDSGRGYDPARALGTYQADDFASHTHTFPADTTGGFNTPIASIVAGDRAPGSTGTVINSTGGSETRPKNVALVFIIRAL